MAAPSATGRAAPPDMTGRGSLRAFRRRVILDAARRVFAEKGMAGLSMREIALAAACTTGAIYPLFAGRDDILSALLMEALLPLPAELRQAELEPAARPASGPAGRLKRLALAWHGYFAARPMETVLLRDLPPDIPAGAELKAALDASLAPLSQAVAETGGLSAAMAARETAGLFALLLGLLLRPLPLGQTPAAVLDHHLDALIARLQWE